jgi:outer membrane protein assembly factor BamB
MLKFYRIIFLVLIGLYSCKKQEQIWEANIDGVTSSSSPQCADLDGDGIKDIVMGAGGEEWSKTDKGIIAINGFDGQILWTSKSRNQIVGSALFFDINSDKTPDVIIGGRSAELQAIDGKTGKIIWEFYSKPGKLTGHDEGWYNFFNPQIVMDQDNDGLDDILICNGGDALIAAGSIGRPAGKLLLISGKNGKLLFEKTMPDGAETYFSPVCFDCATNKNPTIIFGSGGETQAGHLYKCLLSDLKNSENSFATIIDTSKNKGFIAPPILADFNNDKQLDLLVNIADGQTKLYDGKTLKPIWSVSCDSSEIYSQPAIGYFYGNDKYLDVFVNFAKGGYPTYTKTEAYLIDGKTGKIVQKFDGKRFTYSSPLVADLNQDGTDEVIMNSVLDYKERDQEKPYYQLTTFDFKNNTQNILGDKKYGACFASTPWLGDLDNDGKADLIYTGSPAAISEFPGTTTFIKPPLILNVFRLEFENIASKSIKWGNYMGQEMKSIFN